MLLNLSKILKHYMLHVTVLLETCNATEFKKNSRTPYVTCDGPLERCNVPEFKQNSKTPFVTCDGFIKKIKCSRI